MDDRSTRSIDGDLASARRVDLETAQERYHLVLQALRDAFGSQTRGEAWPGSDHDLYVVIEALPREPLNLSPIANAL